MRFSSIPLLAIIVAGVGGCALRPDPQGPPQYQGYPGYAQPQGYYGQPYGQAPGQPQILPQIYRPVNVPALLAIQNIPCAPKEVAPGTWAKFDCGPWQAMQRVIQYFPMPRLNFLPGGPVPAAVDHRAEGMEGPIRDQGAVGACTAVSLAGAMDNAIRRMGRQDVASALHIWSNFGTPMMSEAGDRNVDKSLSVEPTWAYDPVKACKMVRAAMDTCTTAYGVSSGSESFDPALRAEHARADASGRYKITALERLKAKPADPGEMAGVLAGGDDIWISFSVDDKAWMSRNLQNAVVPDYEVTEETGHAVVLAGYRTLPNGTKQFLIHNSWGPRWGENGYGWISEAMVARHTRMAFRVRVADAGAPSVPVPGAAPAAPGASPSAPGFPGFPGIPGLPGFPGFPAPGAAPAPAQPGAAPQGACPQGQGRDVVSGQCAALCAGGSPTVGGMCVPFGAR